MQENQLFEYAVIRVVPRVEREEFINVGVILYCAKQKFLQTMFGFDRQRLLAFSNKVDLMEIEECFRAFEQICLGSQQGGPIGKLPIASRFRWLTATRSAVVQTSKVHPGLCMDPLQMLIRLHEQLVV